MPLNESPFGLTKDILNAEIGSVSVAEGLVAAAAIGVFAIGFRYLYNKAVGKT